MSLKHQVIHGYGAACVACRAKSSPELESLVSSRPNLCVLLGFHSIHSGLQTAEYLYLQLPDSALGQGPDLLAHT